MAWPEFAPTPKRVTPRRIISTTVCKSRTPPAALTWAASPTADLIKCHVVECRAGGGPPGAGLDERGAGTHGNATAPDDLFVGQIVRFEDHFHGRSLGGVHDAANVVLHIPIATRAQHPHVDHHIQFHGTQSPMLVHFRDLRGCALGSRGKSDHAADPRLGRVGQKPLQLPHVAGHDKRADAAVLPADVGQLVHFVDVHVGPDLAQVHHPGELPHVELHRFDYS